MAIDKKQRADLLRETIESGGWIIIDEWLNKQEKRIVDAIKDSLLSMKWEERGKWFAYYSGEVTIIQALRKYIDNTLNTDLFSDVMKRKVKNFLDKK